MVTICHQKQKDSVELPPNITTEKFYRILELQIYVQCRKI